MRRSNTLRDKRFVAVLCHIGQALMENRNGLAVGTSLTKVTGTAEPEAAIAVIGDLPDEGRIILGADKRLLYA